MPPPDPEEHVEALKVLALEGTAALASQTSAVDRLETKGTILLGFNLTAIQLTLIAKNLHVGWRVAAIVAYAAALTAGLVVVAPYTLKTPPRTRRLLEERGASPLGALLTYLIAERALAFEENVNIVRRKYFAWWSALGLITTAVAFSIAAEVAN